MYLLILISFFNATTPLLFTSHYVSINSVSKKSKILWAVSFTSHYVSINSELCKNLLLRTLHLHPTMYLLIPIKLINRLPIAPHLHPTMYLLIPVIIKASLFLNSEALFCLPFKSANRLLILYALNMLEA